MKIEVVYWTSYVHQQFFNSLGTRAVINEPTRSPGVKKCCINSSVLKVSLNTTSNYNIRIWLRLAWTKRWTKTSTPAVDCRLSFRFGIFHIEINMSDLKPPKIYPFYPAKPQGAQNWCEKYGVNISFWNSRFKINREYLYSWLIKTRKQKQEACVI